MLNQELISMNDAAGWQNALTGIPHALAHTWEYVRACAYTKRSTSAEQAVWLYVCQETGARCVCPLAEREWRGRRDIVTPYGFSGFAGVGESPNLRTFWPRFAAQHGWVCGYLGLHPVLDDRDYEAVWPAKSFSQTHSSNHVYALDLTQSETQLAAGLSHNIQQRLRDWGRSGALIQHDQERLRQFFLAEYPGFMRRIGAAPIYDFPVAMLENLLQIESVFLVGAENARGELEAVSAFGSTAYCGEYLFNVALPAGRQHSAALLWEGLLQFKTRSVPVANLGGGIRASDGLDQFKARFGGRRLPLRALKQVYLPDVYRACCQEAGVQAHAAAGYFPPYRAQVQCATG
jgi:hypothetical protein